MSGAQEQDRADDVPAASDVLEFEPLVRSEPPRRLAPKVLALFVVLLALGGGVSWFYWGNDLAVKAGYEVPTIHAESTPYKVRPADPGGMAVPNRDKLVYNRMNGEDVPLPPVEKLLAPAEQPKALPGTDSTTQNIPIPPAPQPSDKSAAQAGNAAGGAVGDAMKTANAVSGTVDSKSGDAKGTPPSATESLMAPPPPTPSQPTSSGGASSSEAKGAPLPEDLSQSLKSVLGDQGTAKSSAITPPPNLDGGGAAKTSPETTVSASKGAPGVSGVYLVQLAAMRERALVDSEWARLQKAYPDLLGTLRLYVTEVKLAGKGVFFRLRAGPLASQNAAKDLCAQLEKRKEGCLIVRP